VLALLVALGDHGPWSPWSWLHRLPIHRSTRVPTRVLATAVSCFALAGAIGLDRRPLLARVAVVAFALNLACIGLPISFAALGPRQDLSPKHGRPFRQFASQDQLDSIRAFVPGTNTLDVLSNRSNLICYEPLYDEPHVRLLPERLGELELLLPSGPAQGQARISRFSPGALQVELAGLREEAVLVVNQNFDEGWQRADGEPVLSARGRIATVVTPSTVSVAFHHRPLFLYLGAALSLLTALVLRVLGRRLNGRGTRRSHPAGGAAGATPSRGPSPLGLGASRKSGTDLEL
jgi:hypothetical protein